MLKLPDIFPLGIAFERLAAQISSAGTNYDQHQVEDMNFHLDTFVEHKRGSLLAQSRGDPYNVLIEEADAGINIFFAWVVASRIIDPVIRSQAFETLNELIGAYPLWPKL